MSTSSAYLTVADLGVDVVYKDIKNLHISVYPPMGRVRVAAPRSTDEDTIRLAVVHRLPWIKRQREQLRAARRQRERQMLSGETHYVWGQRYLLDVSRTSGHYSVEPKRGTLWVVAPEGTDADGRRSTLDRWYRRELKAAAAPLLDKWQPLIGVETDKVVIRRMKTKWGTCIPRSRTIWLNPELAKKNPAAWSTSSFMS
nr:YgjP-like metallopeptidase domain-containing protein [Pseudonocardia sp. AL041005-10]